MQNWRALQNLMQIWKMQRQAGHKKPWTVRGTSVKANSNANIIYGLLKKKHSNIFQDDFNHIGVSFNYRKMADNLEEELDEAEYEVPHS